MLNGWENLPKLCLIEPPYTQFIADIDAPFSLLYLAAIAEQNEWNVEIVDMQTLDDPLPGADLYGVTATSPQWPAAVNLAKRLKQEYPSTLTVCGGPHVSARPYDGFASEFDITVVGEGEKALENILRACESFVVLRYSNIIHGEPIINLDEVPFPARHLIDWKKYKRGIYWGADLMAPAVSIISSRGCPYGCIFCGSHSVFGRRVRFRSVANVVAEIQQVIASMGYHGFNFHDDTFCINRARVFDLCKEFEKLNIVWRCLSRADTVDKDVVKAMSKAGCKEVILGVETGSQKILDNLNKGTTVETNLHAMKALKKGRIQLKVGLIVGSPGETFETVEATKKLMKQCPPDFWNVSVFTPFPGCDVAEHPEKYNVKILTTDLTELAMVGKEFKGNVVMETEAMSKSDIEQARDDLIDFMMQISPPPKWRSES